MSHRIPSFLLFPIVLAGCETVRPQSSTGVFENPASHLGELVTACGYLSGPANIKSGSGHGLSINSTLGRRLVAIGNEREVCLYGRLTYLGCKTDPGVICTDAAYDYAIKAERIL